MHKQIEIPDESNIQTTDKVRTISLFSGSGGLDPSFSWSTENPHKTSGVIPKALQSLQTEILVFMVLQNRSISGSEEIFLEKIPAFFL